jgi:hypothetical protein
MGLTIIISTKLMLCKIILIIIIIFIIYIEGYMNIFIIHIGIVGPLSCFNYINFKASLIIKIINSNEIFKMAHLVMLVVFHVNVIICQIFNLPNIYHIFVKEKKKIQINHTLYASNYMK